MPSNISGSPAERNPDPVEGLGNAGVGGLQYLSSGGGMSRRQLFEAMAVVAGAVFGMGGDLFAEKPIAVADANGGERKGAEVNPTAKMPPLDFVETDPMKLAWLIEHVRKTESEFEREKSMGERVLESGRNSLRGEQYWCMGRIAATRKLVAYIDAQLAAKIPLSADVKALFPGSMQQFTVVKSHLKSAENNNVPDIVLLCPANFVKKPQPEEVAKETGPYYWRSNGRRSASSGDEICIFRAVKRDDIKGVSVPIGAEKWFSVARNHIIQNGDSQHNPHRVSGSDEWSSDIYVTVAAVEKAIHDAGSTFVAAN